jgi:cytochrome c oxidase subunit III
VLRHSMHLMPKRQQLYQAKLGFYMILASLAVFFFASLMAYVLIAQRTLKPNHIPLELPWSFTGSTVALLMTSVALHLAVMRVRIERQMAFRRWLQVAVVSATIFFSLQSHGMQQLISVHLSAPNGDAKLFGISFVLAFIHAMHVIVGMLFIAYVYFQAGRNRYDHEKHWPVDICSTYWHFLDGVWLIMLATFIVVV